MMVNVALNFAAAFGVNAIANVALCPGLTTSGNKGDVRAKYFVEVEAPVIVTALLPEFVPVTVSVLLVPGLIPPKSMLALAKARFPLCCGPDWLNP